MSPVRRERALAVRETAAGMALDPMAKAAPLGRVEAIRIMLQVPRQTGPADWAEARRVRERERMRRRREAGDPGIREAHRRWMERLHAGGRDRYRRLLAIVRDRQGHDVAQILIRERHARPYDGRGRREGWCG